MSMAMQVRERCPVCGSSVAEHVSNLVYDDTWAAFEHDFGVVIPEAVRTANMPAEEISLVRCESCGLERFEPLMSGDPGFYEALMSAVPYTEDRWDFRTVRRRIDASDDVLDLGCGEGRFLKSLGPRTGRTVGVDHHGPAIARFVAADGEGYEGTFESFAASHGESFDVVTSFHTLEHVASPMEMLRAAASCLRPSGTLYVSVPNRERSWRQECEPMDRPPHHVTRWGPSQIGEAAQRSGLTVEAIGFEPPDLSVARALIERSAIERLPDWSRRGAVLPVRIWSRIAMPTRRYRREARRGAFAARGTFGHSLLATLRVGSGEVVSVNPSSTATDRDRDRSRP